MPGTAAQRLYPSRVIGNWLFNRTGITIQLLPLTSLGRVKDAGEIVTQVLIFCPDEATNRLLQAPTGNRIADC